VIFPSFERDKAEAVMSVFAVNPKMSHSADSRFPSLVGIVDPRSEETIRVGET
jgi:hypothetical protein